VLHPQKTKARVAIKIKRFIVSSSQTDLRVKDIAASKKFLSGNLISQPIESVNETTVGDSM